VNGSLRRRFRAPRQLRVTGIGWYYLALTVGMGMAGINGGNNLILLTCGLMLGLVVASGILSERCLRGLTVLRHLPTSATVGQATLVGLELSNGKRAASFGILVEELLDAPEPGARCQFALVAGRTSQQRSYSLTPRRRGRMRLKGFRVATRFPFGLFEKSLEIDLPEEMRVRPAPLPCPAPEVLNGARGGEAPAASAGVGVDPWQLRPHLEGEDARTIAWGPSARTGQLLALEREQRARQSVELNLRGAGSGPQFEKRVGETAFLAEALMYEGLAVSLAAGGQRLLGPGFGPAHLGRLLDLLVDVGVESP
jgi:uncharacterized protein (DUF58 family)